ncbi:MAG: peptidoglycan-binding protein, partial [Microcystis panniformis]
KLYLTNFRNSHPNAALIATNNLSIARGGNTSIHQTHETGLSCDILLPRRDGTFGRITFRDGVYDRDAMEAMLRSIRNQGKYRIKQIFFNDFSLVVKGLCQNLNDGGVHDNHAHIDIEPPQL